MAELFEVVDLVETDPTPALPDQVRVLREAGEASVKDGEGLCGCDPDHG